MHRNAVKDYVSPVNGERLELEASLREGDDTVEGLLHDRLAGAFYPIVGSIPRFVRGANYADSFGFQWNRYRRIQLDSYNGSTLTSDRFYAGTGWQPEDLKGRRVLEAGCGAGRFSEILLQAGAKLYSFDYSSAVNAAWQNNQHRKGWNLCQADIFAIPFRERWFDYVFCYGVLQHTPDPERAFLNLTRYLKPGGRIAIDVYAVQTSFNKLSMKYLYRPITRRLPPTLLLRVFEWYLPWWTPVDTFLQRIPYLGRWLSAIIPCWNKSSLPLAPEHQLEWTILDTFDAFSCEFDYPQTVETVRSWCQKAGLVDMDVRPGGNGVECRARAREA